MQYLQQLFNVSRRRGCEVARMRLTTYRYKPKKDEQAFLRMKIKEIASARVRYGYRRIHVLLKREGWKINHKRVYRIYCQEGLNLRNKTKRKHLAVKRVPDRSAVVRVNECWSMDFVSDQLYNGKRFRALTVLDVYSRECLAMHADQGIKAEAVSTVLEFFSDTRGLPKRIKVDNGPEFISRVLNNWAYFNKVYLDYSRPGRPIDNAYIESFNGSFRDECLNVNWFMSLDDARTKIEVWRKDYDEFRPHSGLTYLTPVEYALRQGVSAD